MNDLIERLEAATEGSRELDMLVEAQVTGGEPAPDVGPRGYCVVRSDWDMAVEPKLYSTSIDSALSLADPKEAVGILHAVTWQRHIGDIPIERVPLVLCARILKEQGQAGETR